MTKDEQGAVFDVEDKDVKLFEEYIHVSESGASEA